MYFLLVWTTTSPWHHSREYVFLTGLNDDVPVVPLREYVFLTGLNNNVPVAPLTGVCISYWFEQRRPRGTTHGSMHFLLVWRTTSPWHHSREYAFLTGLNNDVPVAPLTGVCISYWFEQRRPRGTTHGSMYFLLVWTTTSPWHHSRVCISYWFEQQRPRGTTQGSMYFSLHFVRICYRWFM